MAAPVFERAVGTKFAFQGFLDEYLRNITEQWIKVAPRSNPGMLQILRDRDRKPLRNMMVWAGEFPGKYLTGAVQVLRLTGDPELKTFLAEFVKDLVACQDVDGYLGPWPKDSRLTGKASNFPDGGCTWDAWGHYHVMLGLMLWAGDTGDKKALQAARRIGDLFCDKFLNTGRRLLDNDSTEMNLAPAHSLAILHQVTGQAKYLQMAKEIVEDFAAVNAKGPMAGDYLRGPLAGKEFFELPRPRWESLHPIMGLAELFWITGDAQYRTAFERLYWSILKGDRHNNGAFSSGEKATGNPYAPGSIETCCTIAWIAMSVEMLRMTGSSIVADELELSTLNTVVGYTSASGRWVTYDTPMDGVRCASAHSIVFQSREGTPELNCCSVNGHRGFGLVSDWALMTDQEGGLVLNYYGPGTMTAKLKAGVTVKLVQETDYPGRGKIKLRVQPSRASSFRLMLRIPYWSAATAVKVNGKKVEGVRPGTYLAIDRTWKKGDAVEIGFDMSLHFWAGQKEREGLASIYRGAILMTYDRRFNTMDPDDVPALDARTIRCKSVAWKGPWPKPILLMEFSDAAGSKVLLCDYGSAGEGGTPYKSWLKVTGVPAAEFTPANPLRSIRV